MSWYLLSHMAEFVLSQRTLEDAIFAFIKNMVMAHQSTIYKLFGATAKIRTQLMFRQGTINYINDVYKSLILKNDDYVISCFTKLKSSNEHSEVCICRMILSGCMAMYNVLASLKTYGKTTKCDGYDTYMAFVSSAIDSLAEKIKLNLIRSMNHKCTSVKIDTCDPDIPLFILSACPK